MISRASETPSQAYVWVWLPGKTEPVVTGLLTRAGGQLVFNYGRSYLARPDAISLYAPELPLRAGVLPPAAGLMMPSAIRDAAPDAWGRRVIINRMLGQAGKDADPVEIDELTYMLQSGSDRIGALDFQKSATIYVPRDERAASLAEMQEAAELMQKGVKLPKLLDAALFHGSSIGGARPKANITDGQTKYIAKFSAQADVYSMVKAEFVAMRLASHAGLNVAQVRLTQAAGKDVLLIERFDRQWVMGEGWTRRAMVSGLTLLSLDEMMARYASYQDFAEIIRLHFRDPRATLHELYSRLMFNILVGNTDDHARNHAAFWDGQALTLTPAYDICPQGRAGNEATQAMLIIGDDRMSRIMSAVGAATRFQLSREQALEIAQAQIEVIRTRFGDVCDEAGLSEVDRELLWRRQFLNPFAFDSVPAELLALVIDS
ncbi:type II toxin-antitoxin system HipA family toxin [Devosia psychrophila]|uniref:Phosphatidylinositol kinase n=1 Tax=Devosia psychrophila TaxID=728005 RepID=A0A0F5PZD7_9HYPH|nr:type II toxin-antitoxin system HipA family toxin [Devosia psychrophila]KKC34023.1 phosphatidylinositol kinase [Devosia psychrophila]SFD39844.1 serine/threonine-protein kinase HipA [Devosia psychrophila]